MFGPCSLFKGSHHKAMVAGCLGKGRTFEFVLKASKIRRVIKSLLTALVIALLIPNVACSSIDTIKIAVIGPLSGKDRSGGQAMLDGVSLRVAQINAQGGINGRNIEVVAYDDQNKKDIARKMALDIAENSNASAVIGHYYSSTSIEGGKVYKKYGIPTLTASATAPEVTEENDWYFRVVPDTNLQGKFAAIYTGKILQQNKAYIVYERDAYGDALSRSFARAARGLGIQIQKWFSVDADADDVKSRLQKIVLELKHDSGPGVLFLACQDHAAAKIVHLVRENGLNFTMIGGDAIGSETFARKFIDRPSAKRDSQFYTDNIYAATFFIRDIGNFNAQQFNQQFKRHFGREPSDIAATSYDAAAIVVESMKLAKPGVDLTQNRKRIQSQLKTFRSIETAHRGVTGHIYFDDKGNVKKSIPIGLYLKNKLISAPIQLTPVVNPNATDNLPKQIKDQTVITIDDMFVHKTMVVYTGFDFIEVSNIDTKSGRFNADFYLWFRHSGHFDYDKIEFLNSAGDIRLKDAITELIDGTILYKAFRIKSDFKENFNFRRYPFDSQRLRIRFRHKQLNSERLLFVADDIGMNRNGKPSSTVTQKSHPTLDPSLGWHLRNVIFYSDINTTDSSLGNPQLLQSNVDADISYSRFNVITEIERNATSYILKNLIPLFIVVLLGYAMLFISPQGPPFVARMNLGVTALLSAIFLSLNAATQLPNIGYLVALDYIYFATYALILSGIAISIAELVAEKSGRYLAAKRLNLFGRIFQPLFLITAIMIFIALWA